MTEKYYNDKGEIGVLVSGGWGSGWSSWIHTPDDPDFFLMDKTLVEMCLRKATMEEVEAYLEAKGIDVWLGGWRDCCVTFLPPNTPFRIHEIDGSETLWTRDDFNRNTGE